MERPVRTSHTATADLLTWSDSPPPSSPSPSSARSATSAFRHTFKPADKISPVMFGAAMSKKEVEDLNKRKPCSDSKLKEMTGSGIFVGKNGSDESEPTSVTPTIKTSVKISQQTMAGISQISFAAQETPSPKKPITHTEVAKQRELSGSLVREETPIKTTKEVSETKIKELSGSDIFGPPPQVPARQRTTRNEDLKGNVDFTHPKPRTLHTSVKVSSPAGGPSSITFSEEPVVKTYRKINEQKFQELTGHGIFKETMPAKSSPDRTLSEAKLREMSGSNIFSDGPNKNSEPATRDYFGGSRQPPGGQSTIALI
ncbi:N-lysine methyltransferase [Rhynchospora pubera]|uniref:N-lysine methyltransferase n=1 Tax=Rhynchospora pubera TaxID=906938 RepID=A0AAV8CEF1_9POAL|nr:N-lysine methyltransferase [Rhynchospora pubera]